MNYTYFEDSLCDLAGLFSLSKNETDMFLLLQCGMITYRQLKIAGIHGKTEASGRLSLKKAEQEGLVKSAKISEQEQTIVFTLTAKGKTLALNTFANVLNALDIVPDKLQVPSARQLLHRIRANDFYFAYIGQPGSIPLLWNQEHSLPPSDYFYAQQPPRCDGYLKSEYGEYYIEQDNGTQSETVLLKKIRQYTQSCLFDMNNKTLIFCLAFTKQTSKTKPSYSIYKILLKFTKLWEVLEAEQGIALDYRQFLTVLERSSLRSSVTTNELRNFSKIHQIHPDADSLLEINRLRQAYLHDTSALEAADEELDSSYKKRLKSHFRAFYEENPKLFSFAYLAKSIYAIPNHRLPFCIPYVLHKELDLKTILLHFLYCNGLNTDNWQYKTPLAISDTLCFKYGFQHDYYGNIVFETPAIDLAAEHRVQYLINYSEPFAKPLILILLGLDEITNEYADINQHAEQRNITVLRTRTLPSHKTTQLPLLYKLNETQNHVVLECDDFDEQIRILESGV